MNTANFIALRNVVLPLCRYVHLLLITVLLVGCNNSGGSIPNHSTLCTAMTGTATATIKGLVEYEDKIYGTSGFTGATVLKPVRFAEVEVVCSADSTVLATALTDSVGAYAIQMLNYNSPVYVRVKSSAVPDATAIEVHDYSENVYAVPGSNFTTSGTTTSEIAIPVTNQAAAAFNIMDVLTSGAEFVNSMAGAFPPPLVAYWAPPGKTNSDVGTFYCTGYCPRGDGIYVLGNYNGDTDGYDDDVIWHEFGHFVASKYSKDDSPGGVHYLSSNNLDLRLSWSEGWGDFFPGAVKTWLANSGRDAQMSTDGQPLTYYVDTNGSGAGIPIDFGSPGGYPYYYSSSEVAVAKVLLDIMNDGTLGMPPIWDVFTNFLPTISSTLNHWVNLEAFWDGWLERRAPGAGELSALQNIFLGRQILYQPDSSEPNDDMGSAKLLTIGIASADRTLYTSGTGTTPDADYYLFTSTTNTITIQTSGLKNGTDTYLTLYNDAGTILDQNDNASGITWVRGNNYDYFSNGDYIYPLSDASTLASAITFKPAAAGTYYVRVTTSPGNVISAGRYGTYTLTITAQ